LINCYKGKAENYHLESNRLMKMNNNQI